ncbi:hypothetical protein ABVK25_007062 [Lepraria finkii]|uniref:Uncharacterized protein n=1 Tax=Lepraria finkii TaxID=1340010 RepID=A0ABR4B599_9LECA
MYKYRQGPRANHPLFRLCSSFSLMTRPFSRPPSTSPACEHPPIRIISDDHNYSLRILRQKNSTTPANPPPSYSSQYQPKHHSFPSARTCWPCLTIASFSLFNCPDRAILLRRLCMCIVLALDTFNSVLSIVSYHFAFSNIPRIILVVLFFFYEAYLLHLIG